MQVQPGATAGRRMNERACRLKIAKGSDTAAVVSDNHWINTSRVRECPASDGQIGLAQPSLRLWRSRW